MSKLLLKNIKTLIGILPESTSKLSGQEMKTLEQLNNAWLACENGTILAYGSMDDFEGISNWQNLSIIDCENKIVMPGFVDSHTHIVYAQNREQEFVDRINGLSYEDIALRGGGILNSVEKLRNCNENDLFAQSYQRFKEIISLGTVGVEIKSGYGLNLNAELKMLRVIKQLSNLKLIPVKATLLAAHAVPNEYKENKTKYIEYIISEIIPAVSAEKTADFIDVFCEKNYFSKKETIEILNAGIKHGLTPKVHAEQLSHSGGIEAGVECDAISVDHLEFINDNDIQLLLNSKTMPTILPGAAYFLGLQAPPARKLIDAGLALAFASDYNPGSSPSGNMMQVMSMACVQYKLNPEEAINACTINTAYAANLQKTLGSITPGKLANLIITKPISSYNFLPYAFGSNLIEKIIINGKEFN
ncbi:MAG: imidazolonepropionase [Bacteroidetes bacterium]|nr:imidazolonepropionase [Bacteroidota bacterium]